MGRMLRNWLRWRLNAPVRNELAYLHALAERDVRRARAWDGVPANLAERLRTLDEVMGIVDSDRP